jgi:hypothetical protein
MYKTLSNIAARFFTDSQIYKYGFNWSPTYRRSTGKVIDVSEDLLNIKIKIPLSWKNRNYVGSIFGGSMLSATDPIYMIQLINILGNEYVVWDKAATIKYKRPGKETLFCEFTFTSEEILSIKKDVEKKGEVDIIKTPNIITKEGVVIAELSKTIYVASKKFYKIKLQKKAAALLEK